MSIPKVIGWIIVGALVIAGVVIIYRRMNNGSTSREAVKCCVERKNGCACTKWEWKKSSDCASVPCYSTSNQREIIVENIYTHPEPVPTGVKGANSNPGVVN